MMRRVKPASGHSCTELPRSTLLAGFGPVSGGFGRYLGSVFVPENGEPASRRGRRFTRRIFSNTKRSKPLDICQPFLKWCCRDLCWNWVTRSPAFREYRVRPRGQLADRWIADEIEVEMLVQRSVDRPNNPSTRRYHRKRALPSSYPFLVDAGSRSGNCSGMEEAITTEREHCHLRIPSLLMRARAQATVLGWKKRLELQAHSRFGNRSACGLPVATGRRS